jgi:hypothetical protein
MSRSLIISCLLLVGWGPLVTGCAQGYCEEICDYIITCDIVVDKVEVCVEECKYVYDRAPDRCQRITERFADCVDGRGCFSSGFACTFALDDWQQSCFGDPGLPEPAPRR